MKIIVAPDSFKGSLSAKEVCNAIQTGIAAYLPNAEIVKVPMADGGEGTMETLVDATGGQLKSVTVKGPLGNLTRAKYGILGDGKTVVVEMASASGLLLIAKEQRNPLRTSTYGTGELIRAALDDGYRDFIIGIGGSATNDGGVGMAQALGAVFTDKTGRDLEPGGGSLGVLDRIDTSGFDPRIKISSFKVACDVDNPLCGENGASAVFGPQKGATPEMVEILDRNLDHLAEVIKKDLGKDVRNIPGAGAAGGLGAGLISFCNAELKKGIEITIAATQLKEKMQGAQLVITGEGQMDGQSSRGKTPCGVAAAAREMGIPVIAIVGSLGAGAHEMYQYGINAMFPILERPETLENCLAQAGELLTRAAERVIRAVTIKIQEKN